jgi:hypothetical protein
MTQGRWLIVNVCACVALATGVTAQQPTVPPPAAEAAAVESPVMWGGEVDVLSQYVWRGFPYSQGKVVWPTAWVSAHGLTATLFLNYDPNWSPTWNEYDLTFTYERRLGRWTLDGTYTRYVYYEGDRRDATSELIAGVALALGPGEIFTTHAFDVELYKGAYYMEAGYSVERELDARSSISVDGSIAFWSRFIDKYTEGKDVHITDGLIGPLSLNLSYERTIAPALVIRPHLSFIRIGDRAGRLLLDPPGATIGVAVVFGK